jgi:hypothetical protein
MKRKHAALITLLLLALLVAATGFWLRAQQQQYALNRALIAALIQGDNKICRRVTSEAFMRPPSESE